jgi:hypothetical protein
MANIEDERQLSSIANDEKETVLLGNKKVHIGWLKRGTLRKFSSIMVDNKTDPKSESQVTCKLAACVMANGFFRIKFIYPLLWRWYYYIKQYDDSVLLPIIEMGKKKVQLTEYYSIMMLAQGLKDTLQTMTREEANRILQELSSAHRE